ncbi:MAG: hypothetical protein FJ207_08330 [Gemmatimonadetes bacterium]|nr:hypothetical protein [Gemmatimonadota bacterium]
MRPTGRVAHLLLGSAFSAMAAGGWAPDASAQDIPGVSVGGGMMIRNLRSSEQPVAPIFDGWYHEADGTVSLCYGYHSLNLDQDVDVPLGPDNFLEPRALDGAQPTHFDEVPPEYRRHFCAFTVNVRSAEGADSVVWRLTTHGVSLEARATGSPYYRIDEPDQASRSVHAPRVAILEPVAGPEVRGRSNHVDAGRGFRAGVDERVPLSARVAAGPGAGDDLRVRMLWTLHQGPGAVSIEEEDEVVSGAREVRHTTSVRFSSPGDYVLRLQAVDWADGNSFGFHCCFTNAYVKVSVE